MCHGGFGSIGNHFYCVDKMLGLGAQATKSLVLGKIGDQYVLLQVETPPAQTVAQRALYEKMAEEMPFNPRAGW